MINIVGSPSEVYGPIPVTHFGGCCDDALPSVVDSGGGPENKTKHIETQRRTKMKDNGANTGGYQHFLFIAQGTCFEARDKC